ncbi:Alpha-scruin [Araneus ventricosus]|uniref:Alpha-scruin n=1 Tax=Araneus ventricosus TaxID=182803 RepID=A0A4Y2B280_ARAVE|nr:Alpha-scruin [Araneus ventricosus]
MVEHAKYARAQNIPALENATSNCSSTSGVSKQRPSSTINPTSCSGPDIPGIRHDELARSWPLGLSGGVSVVLRPKSLETPGLLRMSILSAVEIYYPKRDQWSLVKPMPEAIMGMACAVMDGCVWMIGGIVNEGQSTRYSLSNRVYTFDIEQQNWYHKVSLPEPRAYACAASLKREIWLWCGVKESLSDDGYLTSTNTVFVFNPEIGKWEHHSAIGTPKHSAAVAKFGKKNIKTFL